MSQSAPFREVATSAFWKELSEAGRIASVAATAAVLFRHFIARHAAWDWAPGWFMWLWLPIRVYLVIAFWGYALGFAISILNLSRPGYWEERRFYAPTESKTKYWHRALFWSPLWPLRLCWNVGWFLWIAFKKNPAFKPMVWQRKPETVFAWWWRKHILKRQP